MTATSSRDEVRREVEAALATPGVCEGLAKEVFAKLHTEDNVVAALHAFCHDSFKKVDITLYARGFAAIGRDIQVNLATLKCRRPRDTIVVTVHSSQLSGLFKHLVVLIDPYRAYAALAPLTDSTGHNTELCRGVLDVLWHAMPGQTLATLYQLAHPSDQYTALVQTLAGRARGVVDIEKLYAVVAGQSVGIRLPTYSAFRRAVSACVTMTQVCHGLERLSREDARTRLAGLPSTDTSFTLVQEDKRNPVCLVIMNAYFAVLVLLMARLQPEVTPPLSANDVPAKVRDWWTK